MVCTSLSMRADAGYCAPHVVLRAALMRGMLHEVRGCGGGGGWAGSGGGGDGGERGRPCCVGAADGGIGDWLGQHGVGGGIGTGEGDGDEDGGEGGGW